MRKVMTCAGETVTYDLRVGDLVAIIGRIEQVHEETERLTVSFSRSGGHPFARPEDSDTRVEVSVRVIMPIANQSGNDSHYSPQNFTDAEPKPWSILPRTFC